MAGYQYTIIIGNVGRDPELRYTQNGVAVCDFRVAVNRTWNDLNTNERREQTTWFRVTAWRALAETVNQYVHKGMQIMVAGTVDASAYLAQDGQPRHPWNSPRRTSSSSARGVTPWPRACKAAILRTPTTCHLTLPARCVILDIWL